jgi:hypothetical protein
MTTFIKVIKAGPSVVVLQKGGEGSGSWNGPGDPRFAKEGASGEDVNKLPIRTYIRSTQGEGYIITHTPTGVLINLNKRAKADASDSREVNSSDLIAVFNDKTQKWDRVKQEE